MKITTSAPIVLQGANKQENYYKPEESYYAEDEGDFVDYSFSQADGFYQIDGNSYFYNSNTDEFSSIEGEDDFYNADDKPKESKSRRERRKESKAEAPAGEEKPSFLRRVGTGVAKVGKGIAKGATAVARGVKNFVGKLKPKKGARKLRKVKAAAGKAQYVDTIPPVDANRQKIEGDGTIKQVNPSDIVKGADGKNYDKNDLNKSGQTKVMTNEETGQKELVKIVDESNTKTLQTTDGENVTFRAEDLEETKDGSTKMSKGVKIALIAGGVIIAGVIVFLIVKSSKKK